MEERLRIADQLRRVAEGGAWHGPSLRELLHDVDAGRAASLAIPGAHTIWELVLHATAWRRAARRRLQGERAELPEEEDWPATPAEPGEAAWHAALRELDEAGRELRAALEAFPEERLHEPLAQGMDSAYVLLHGVAQHDAYHAGQVAVLKRALGMARQG